MEFGKRAEDRGREDPLITLARMDERLKSFGDKFDTYTHATKGTLQALNSKIDAEILELKKDTENILLNVNQVRDKVFTGVGIMVCAGVVLEWVISVFKR